MKNKVVVFQDNYARILINPEDSLLDQYKESGIPMFINPNLGLVKGVSPEFWKADIENNRIISMSEDERNDRIEEDELHQPFDSIIIKEIIKEIPVEVIKEVEKIVNIEVIKEVPVEVIREVERVVNISIPTVETVYIDRVKEIEVIKEVQVPVLVNKEITKLVFQKYVPKSVIAVLVIESAIIAIGLLIKLLG